MQIWFFMTCSIKLAIIVFYHDSKSVSGLETYLLFRKSRNLSINVCANNTGF